MSRLAYHPPFTKARIKFGYVDWYRRTYKVARGSKFPYLRDGMKVYLLNDHALQDQSRGGAFWCWSVLGVDQELFGVIPAQFLEVVQPERI